MLRVLLEVETDGHPIIDMEGLSSTTPLLQACIMGCVDASRQLIEAAADVNKASSMGSTPLMAACEHGQTQVVSLLIQMRADLNQADQKGRSPLLVACFCNELEAAKLLLAAGARKDRCNAREGPLHTVVLLKHTDAVRLLLQNRADIDEKAEDGTTALVRACILGCTDMVQLLLQNGASKEVTTSSGHTALQVAHRLGFLHVENLLTADAGTIESAPKKRRRMKGPP